MPSLNEIDILKNVDLPRVSEFEKTEFSSTEWFHLYR